VEDSGGHHVIPCDNGNGRLRRHRCRKTEFEVGAPDAKGRVCCVPTSGIIIGGGGSVEDSGGHHVIPCDNGNGRLRRHRCRKTEFEVGGADSKGRVCCVPLSTSSGIIIGGSSGGTGGVEDSDVSNHLQHSSGHHVIPCDNGNGRLRRHRCRKTEFEVGGADSKGRVCCVPTTSSSGIIIGGNSVGGSHHVKHGSRASRRCDNGNGRLRQHKCHKKTEFEVGSPDAKGRVCCVPLSTEHETSTGGNTLFTAIASSLNVPCDNGNGVLRKHKCKKTEFEVGAVDANNRVCCVPLTVG